VQIVLWLAAGTYAVVGFLGITGALGSAREADSLRHAYAVFTGSTSNRARTAWTTFSQRLSLAKEDPVNENA
jgi:hypothetical protein